MASHSLTGSNHSRAGKSEALLCSMRMRLDLSALRKITYKLNVALLGTCAESKIATLYPQIGYFSRGHPFVVMSKTIVDAIECTPSVLFCTTITSKVHSTAVRNRSLIFIHSFNLTVLLEAISDWFRVPPALRNVMQPLTVAPSYLGNVGFILAHSDFYIQ